jgi:hypothetical protein
VLDGVESNATNVEESDSVLPYQSLCPLNPTGACNCRACRCLHTATLVLEGVQSNATNVEEFVRETLGMDTCDARRSVSDPNSNPAPAPKPQVCSS